jgi:hypothetical protein
MLSMALSVVLAAASVGQVPTPPVINPPTINKEGGTIQTEARKIEGQWQVAYIEMDGKKIEDKDFGNVTIRGNVLTCKHDGKEKSWKLEFGPHQRVRAEETTVKDAAVRTPPEAPATASPASSDVHSHGVYIAAKDYLCFSMMKGRDITGGAGREPGATPNQPDRGGATSDHGASGSHFVLILHRTSYRATTR